MNFILPVLIILAPFSARALDMTAIVEVDQSWARDGRQISRLAGDLEMSQYFEKNGSITAIVRSQLLGPDTIDPGRGDQPSVSPMSRRWNVTDSLEVELRELYWDVDFAKGHVRLGKQQVVWGQADGLKLLDVVNPQSFREFILQDFDDSRIPLWMLNLEWFLDLGDLQFLWIPDTTMHDLPGAGSTFEMTAPFAGIPADLPVNFGPVNRPDSILSDADYGLRLSMFRAGWNLTLNYIYHYDDFPVIRQSLDANGLLLSIDYERTHTIGGSASNAFGDFILRVEMVYNSDKYVRVQPDAVNRGVEPSKEIGYVIGIDWSGLTDTFLSVQLFQSVLLDDVPAIRDDTDSNLTFLIRRNFLNESLLFELLWIYHLNDDDNLLRLKTSYELTSNTSVSFYADVFNGEADELFGQLDDRDQIGLRFTVGF